jgi:ferric-dicitrate binding protein FerR (iron transport regulator)
LTAGQSATSQADGTTTRDPHTDAAAAFAWTTGQLSLPYVPLGDGLVRLERWFDIDVVLADRALASRHLNITLQDETPRQALVLIAEAIGARVSWHGRTATLHPLPTDR